MDGFVAVSADSLDETGVGSCGLAGIGGSRGWMKTVAGAGSVAGLLRGAGDGAGGSWIAECVLHLVGGSYSSSLLQLLRIQWQRVRRVVEWIHLERFSPPHLDAR